MSFLGFLSLIARAVSKFIDFRPVCKKENRGSAGLQAEFFKGAGVLFSVLLVAPLLGYSQSLSGLSCTASVPSTPQTRAEGFAELVGDLVITCTGGTPTGLNAAVPTVNITVSINTQITSRLLDTTNSVTEALLLINDPGPSSALTQSLCPPVAANNYGCANGVYGTGSGGGKGITPVQYTNANAYQGVMTAVNQLTFFNSPLALPRQASRSTCL